MKHLTQVQRYQIEGYIKSGYSNSKIAQRLSVHKSSISREIRRNSLNRESYDGKRANDFYQRGKRKAGAQKKKAHGDLKEKVEGLIRQEYSPEQITGRLRLQGESSLSHSCIYRLIWEDKAVGGDLHTYLRHRRKRSRKHYGKADNRGCIINRVSIDQRPQVVDYKERIGDCAHPYSSWERGLNEYQNKLIRQYIPKKTVFKNVSPQQVRKIQNKLNTRPRKGLGFLTPEEFIAQELNPKNHALFKRA